MRSWREKRKSRGGNRRRKSRLSPAETERLSEKLAAFYLFILYQGRRLAAAVLCAGRPSRWWEEQNTDAGRWWFVRQSASGSHWGSPCWSSQWILNAGSSRNSIDEPQRATPTTPQWTTQQSSRTHLRTPTVRSSSCSVTMQSVQ